MFTWTLNCFWFFFWQKIKKTKAVQSPSKHIWGVDLPEFEINVQRYEFIANWAASLIPKDSITFIEGYSFASKGQVFNIGENTGILKYMLWRKNISFDVVAPGTVKKFATGKGNAKKPAMLEAFHEETNFHLEKFFAIEERKNKSPACDIADAYFICKYAFETFMS